MGVANRYGSFFAIVLVASVTSQFALFMNGMVVSWSLTELTESPTSFAILNAATTLPTFLLALIAGALADVTSRRRIIIIGQIATTIIVAAYALMSWQEVHTVYSIILLAAGLGVVGAMTGPAWMALIPSLVERKNLGGAMTVSSGASNIIMALGPAIAGLLVALASTTAVFALNVVVLIASTLLFSRYRPTERNTLPAEHLGSAILMGIRYARYDRPLQKIILKMVPYAFAAVALMALLPAVARFQLMAGPSQFGILAGAGGIGALIAMYLGPMIRKHLHPDYVVLLAMLAQAGVLWTLAFAKSITVAVIALVISGVALLLWISSVMTALQAALPPWIRGRGVAVYLLALQGTFTVGALFWGAVAEQLSVRIALMAAAALMAVAGPILLTIKLRELVSMDTTAVSFIELPTSTSVHDNEGPIMVTAQWSIPPEKREQFLAVMKKIHRGLKRNGAIRFQLVESIEEPGKMMESFTMATWAEYQAISSRTTAADQELEALLSNVVGELPQLKAHKVMAVKLD